MTVSQMSFGALDEASSSRDYELQALTMNRY